MSQTEDGYLKVHSLVQEVIRADIPKDQLSDICSSASKMLNHAFHHCNNPMSFVNADQPDLKGHTFELWEHVCVAIVHFLNQFEDWNRTGGDSFAFSSIVSAALVFTHVSNITSQALAFRQRLINFSRCVDWKISKN